MITVDQVMAWEPCYDRARVQALVGDGLTPLELLDLNIPSEHKIWALCQAGAMPEPIRAQAIEAIVTRCVGTYTPSTAIAADDAAAGRVAWAAAALEAWAVVDMTRAADAVADAAAVDAVVGRVEWVAAAAMAWAAVDAAEAAMAWAAAAERDLQLDDFRTAIMAGEGET